MNMSHSLSVRAEYAAVFAFDLFLLGEAEKRKNPRSPLAKESLPTIPVFISFCTGCSVGACVTYINILHTYIYSGKCTLISMVTMVKDYIFYCNLNEDHTT